ncbi:RagB/SusD family nutrient uptake outer membrane protein [Muricauda sp. TY007]|uniref:RagB/SusD family nutrient uptake outer membrane protein n=1 Tax=Allomuricauda sp. TY007 TaxID=2683200 RepID=UPI0013BF7B6D|nr:RagB/SusD family nutrient uptake outer membrane protein [Muricauda sp. TY007]NDV16803.1 RagB/SusD family nutrient uptake outer membrane protein [Muricauda sp. TY007]
MKNSNIKLSVIAALLLLAGCGKDFLDEQPSEFLTQEQVGEAAAVNPAVIEGTISGIYSTMFATESGGTTNHDDFGHKGYDIYGDMLSGDMALSVSTYGWYRADITEFQATQDFTRTRNYMPWRFYYRVIRSANLVIDALGGNDVIPEIEENKFLMGQAKALRAHAYFYLTQYFANSYDPSAEILPIYDSPDDLNGPKVATSEIYALMEKDLNESISLLDGFSRSSKGQVDKTVAQAILAYVLASKGDSHEEVMDLTADVINNGGYTLMNSEEVLGGFNDLNTSGWIWGVDLTVDAGLGLVSWWGQMDLYTYSYAWAGDAKAIDSDLYAAIPEDDVRKQQFAEPIGEYTDLMPLNKFYHPDRVIGGQANITTDYVYLRVAEMYLLHAEAAAKAGDAGAARTILKDLLAERLPSTAYVDGLSGQALLDEIYLQTRIELWGEGKSYLSLKRNQGTVVRGDNHLSNVGTPINYDDERLTFEIPQSEIQNNPSISTQN